MTNASRHPSFMAVDGFPHATWPSREDVGALKHARCKNSCSRHRDMSWPWLSAGCTNAKGGGTFAASSRWEKQTAGLSTPTPIGLYFVLHASTSLPEPRAGRWPRRQTMLRHSCSYPSLTPICFFCQANTKDGSEREFKLPGGPGEVTEGKV